jgi:hypothetical protein
MHYEIANRNSHDPVLTAVTDAPVRAGVSASTMARQVRAAAAFRCSVWRTLRRMARPRVISVDDARGAGNLTSLSRVTVRGEDLREPHISLPVR